jgi:hypothetical protein
VELLFTAMDRLLAAVTGSMRGAPSGKDAPAGPGNPTAAAS